MVSIQQMFGAPCAIGLVAVINGVLIGGSGMPLLITPIGESATLLFGAPEHPITRPWAIIGGNTLSAAIGVSVTLLVHDQATASALAVVAAVLAMCALRCFHPPGSAMALAAVVGNDAVRQAGFSFAIVPIGIDCLLIVLTHRVVRLLASRLRKDAA